jgi:hypothetical protein
MTPIIATLFVFFAEPGFPVVNAPGFMDEMPHAVVARSSAELVEALTDPQRILVWRHGSAFPAEAWTAIATFLEAGGGLVYIGGEPFTRPATGPPGSRTVQPRNLAALKALGLNQCRWLDVGGAQLIPRGDPASARVLAENARVAILEPRFSSTKDFAHEDGAPGSRDAGLETLSYVHLPRDESKFPAAAASIAITRWRGPFAGGRWGLWLLTDMPTASDVDLLYETVARRALELRADPTYGCYHTGERPVIIIRAHQPGSRPFNEITPVVTVVRPDGTLQVHDGCERRGVRHAEWRVELNDCSTPGLYRLRVEFDEAPRVETGFWRFDHELFESGGPLRFDGHTMWRGETPVPVVGTTTMSATVHRKFLFEPNAAVWDDTFAELAALDINVVRTGVWSAYRKVSLDPGAMDEAFLRALEAYYLTARRHGIPIMFTFFAFVPESFGGASPYFDPRSIEGQQAYVATIAGRFARAREMIWDLINEPSFASPDKLWTCRPHGGRYEEAAFREWLQHRYGKNWEQEVRSRWRLLPHQAIGLPNDEDFQEFEFVPPKRHPYRAREYAHFAQDAFAGWMETMTASIRQAGSSAAITVGQDEGGLAERPGPLFHHHVVDLTSIHTWWYNDALLWDGVLAKASAKPMWVSETGVMNREGLSGEALRSDQMSAALLSRKLAYAFASGASGVVQWCYDINPYMDSNNEVSIGCRRVDGSYRPEHAELRHFAAFIASCGSTFRDLKAPEVVVVWPSGDHYSPRGMQFDGTRRAIVDLMTHLQLDLQIVPEYRADQELGHPALIVLPACRGLSQSAWSAIQRHVERGAVLLCSGWFEQDDAGRSAPRLGLIRRPLASVEALTFDSKAHVVTYPLDVIQSAFAAANEETWSSRTRGTGQIIHCSVPLEWSPDSSLRRALYRRAAEVADLSTPYEVDAPSGIIVRVLRFASHDVVIAINERSTDGVVRFRVPDKPRIEVQVPAGFARMLCVDRDGRVVSRSHNAPT